MRPSHLAPARPGSRYRLQRLLAAGATVMLLAGLSPAAIAQVAPTNLGSVDAAGSQTRVAHTTGSETSNRRLRPVIRKDAANLSNRSLAPSTVRPARGRLAATDRQAPRAPSTTLVAPAPSFVSTTANDQANENSPFTGLEQTSAAYTDGEPPDSFVAAGPDHLVQVVNTAIRITDRDGTVVSTADLFDFFPLGELGYLPGEIAYFDPRVVYDSLHGRWLVLQAEFDCLAGGDASVGWGYVDIGVSDSADPTGGWSFVGIGRPDMVPDYPGLGTSTDKVVLSGNEFVLGPSGGMGCDIDPTFVGTSLDIMAWSELTGTGAISLPELTSYAPGADFPNEFFSWRPAVQAPASSATIFLVAERSDEGVAYAKITGNPAGGGQIQITTPITNLTSASVISAFDTPPAPKQPGSPSTIVDAVDARPTDAVWQNNQLAFVSTYPCDPPGGASEDRDCVRVSELNTVPATPTLIQDFLIAEEGADRYMGGIGYAGNGDLHVVWTRSSSSGGQYPSSYTAYQAVTDSINQLSPPDQLLAGSGTYPGDRWGDYVGVGQDPQVPNAVWQGNQASAGTDGWTTRVSQLQTGGSTYVPITPHRVVDSRISLGVSGAFVSSVPKTFNVAGAGPIPADAVAVTGNVTVTGQTSSGFVAVTPDPTATPPSSTINFPLGDTRANNFTIPLNASGDLSAVLRTSVGGKTAQVIVDITGYFLADDTGATFATLTPVRVMDTRAGAGHIGPLNAFSAGITQTLPVAGTNGIPSTAVGITANLTVVGQTRAGYLSVTPDDPPGTPTSSTLNFPLADTRANGLTAALNVDGDLSITYVTSSGTGTTHAILDVTGYFLPDTSGLRFYPLNPSRLLDTRPGVPLSALSGVFSTGVARTFQVNGHWGVPADAEAFTANLTVVGQTSSGFLAVTPVATNNPSTSTLNFPLGDIRANGLVSPIAAGNAAIVYKTSAGGKTTHVLLDLSGYFK